MPSTAKPSRKAVSAEQAGRRVIGRVAHLRVRIPGAAVADAAEAIAASAQMRFEHRLDPAAEAQVGVADDAGASRVLP